ncbi:MAG TPA: DNA-binding protein [Kribbella sp.]|nr:DNA-binding protein [Kribbella sp.]
MEQPKQNLQQQVELYGEPLGEVVRRVTAALGLTQGGLAQVIGLSAPMMSQLVSAQRVKIGNPAVVSRLRAVTELADHALTDAIGPDRVAYELQTIRSATGAYTNPTTGLLRRLSDGPAGQQTGSGATAGSGARTGAGAPTPGSVAQGGAHGAPRGGAPGGAQAPFTAPGGLPVEAPPAAWPTPPPDLSARAVVRELQDLFRAVASADEIQRAAAAAAEESPAVAELLLAYGTGRTADALAHYDQHHG